MTLSFASNLARRNYIIGSTDGTGSTAPSHAPWGLAVDSAATVPVADATNNPNRKGVLFVATAPLIRTRPLSQAVTAGSPVTFTAAASGTPVPTDQWKRDHVNFGGATRATLTLNNAQAGDAVSYSLSATNASGSAAGTAANLAVIPWLSRDFNGDGRADILWRNTATGEYAIWLMRGGAAIGASGFNIAACYVPLTDP